MASAISSSELIHHILAYMYDQYTYLDIITAVQEELDPVVEESEETITKCVKSYPPKTTPFQDTSISSSFNTSSTPKVNIPVCNL